MIEIIQVEAGVVIELETGVWMVGSASNEAIELEGHAQVSGNRIKIYLDMDTYVNTYAIKKVLNSNTKEYQDHVPLNAEEMAMSIKLASDYFIQHHNGTYFDEVTPRVS